MKYHSVTRIKRVTETRYKVYRIDYHSMSIREGWTSYAPCGHEYATKELALDRLKRMVLKNASYNTKMLEYYSNQKQEIENDVFKLDRLERSFKKKRKLNK